MKIAKKKFEDAERYETVRKTKKKKSTFKQRQNNKKIQISSLMFGNTEDSSVGIMRSGLSSGKSGKSGESPEVKIRMWIIARIWTL